MIIVWLGGLFALWYGWAMLVLLVITSLLWLFWRLVVSGGWWLIWWIVGFSVVAIGCAV